MIIYQLNGFCIAVKLHVMHFALETWLKDLSFIKSDQEISCKSKIVNSHLIHNEWKIMGVLFKIMLKHCLKYQSFVTLIPHIWYCPMYSLKTKIFTHVFRFKCNQGWGQSNSGIVIAAQFQFRNWNWNWKPELNFLQLLLQHLLVYQPFRNLALTEEVIIFHVADSPCNRFVF